MLVAWRAYFDQTCSVLDDLYRSVNFSGFEAIIVLKEVELYQVECDADRVFPQNITVNAPLKFLY